MTQSDPTSGATGGNPGADAENSEPITVSDRRRIDPETGEVRPGAPADDQAADAESGDTPEGAADEAISTDARIADLTADLQRERAQFANFRRRAAEEKQGSVTFGKQVLIEKLLPILDDLDRAREHGDLESGPLRSLSDKLGEVLTSEGLAKFGAPGEPFEPDLHEAVQHEGDGAEPVIGALYRSGYRLGDKVIRTAMVTVTDPTGAQ